MYSMHNDEEKKKMKIEALKDLKKQMHHRMMASGPHAEEEARSEMHAKPAVADSMMNHDSEMEEEEKPHLAEGGMDDLEEQGESEAEKEEELEAGEGHNEVKSFFGRKNKIKPRGPALAVMLSVGAKPKKGMK